MSAVKERGIWSWGHVIYDYRGFFRNMKKLGLNKITIWNDFAPVNAGKIINEAHENGISVVWGFSWGWDTCCPEYVAGISESVLKNLSSSVIRTFHEQYEDISADGIYFQSFTELDRGSVGGVNVAESVIELVNMTGEKLLGEHPDLSIEFGLHATSVKNDLETIAKTDRRIKIIWEDLGAFPFSYSPEETGGFDETLELTRKVISLRGSGEKCGFITKGMTKLDWSSFRHAAAPLVIGESSPEFIKQRQAEKSAVWDSVEKGWRENISYAQKMFELFRTSDTVVSVQSLIEDGMFEAGIREPAVTFAQLCGCLPE